MTVWIFGIVIFLLFKYWFFKNIFSKFSTDLRTTSEYLFSFKIKAFLTFKKFSTEFSTDCYFFHYLSVKIIRSKI